MELIKSDELMTMVIAVDTRTWLACTFYGMRYGQSAEEFVKEAIEISIDAQGGL